MKHSLSILFLLMASISYGAFHEGTMVYKNGRTRTGFIEAKLGEVVRFKPWMAAEEEKINSNTLKGVILKTDSGRQVREYHYIQTYAGGGQKKINAEPSWLKLIEKGTVSLYASESVSHNHDGTDQFTIEDFFCVREGEAAQQIASYDSNHTFHAKAPLYFADYPQLAEKIRSKQYLWHDLQNIVKKYNEWVASKKV